MKQTQRYIYLMIFITVSITITTTGNLFIKNEIISNFLNDFQYVAIFISLLTFFIQQLSDQRSKKTEFFIQLKNAFIMDDVLMDTYFELYQYHRDNEYKMDKLEQKNVVKYIAYFDSIAIACENKTIDLKEISRTFSYYFFIAVNNPFVQEIELIPDGEYYSRIYELYKKLYEYHHKHNIDVLMEDTGLHKTEKFEKVLKENSY